MYQIYKITSNPVVDFAAEELKRYLRMMMPRCGEITIEYNPNATEGFRLGLMQEFGLDVSEVKNVELDDIVHIDTDEQGGIIAGDNPRSILLAVYKYLTINGCRWLYPGVDGEFIPIKKVEAVKYHKAADCRYRGQCNEGAESQQAMLETIDWAPKVGMNVYMLEFDIPTVYYDWYYQHRHNTANREPEPVNADTVLQWKRACEAEIAKRGLQFHDIGHGWTVEAFGIDSKGAWSVKGEHPVPEEAKQYLAEIDGERKIFMNIPVNTNFCMSNPKARKIVANYVADYAQENSHVNYIHVWLADNQKNHCECEVCRTKTPSDWYVMLLNDIDEELTNRSLTNRIGIAVYSDTAYEPTCEYIKNPDRFFMILGAITRSYTYSIPKNPQVPLTPFVLNKSGRLETMEEHMMRLKLWQKFVPSPAISYEYHFWRHQFYAPGVLSFAKRLYEDVQSYKDNELDGMIEDGSQRAFFPNGISYYTYANTLFDTSLNFEELVKDYFDHAYGEVGDQVIEFLQKIDELMPHTYMEARHSKKRDNRQHFCPEMEEKLLAVEPLTREFEQVLSQYKNMPHRVQTVSVRMMILYMEYLRGYANAMALKAVGKDEEAQAAAKAFWNEFGKNEIAWERYYDHAMMVMGQGAIFNSKPGLAQ